MPCVSFVFGHFLKGKLNKEFNTYMYSTVDMSQQWVAHKKSGASLYITSSIDALFGSQNPVDSEPQDAKRLGRG